MANKNWRGYAEFDMPSDGSRQALMTICPGNPEQEGRYFRAIMEAAGAKLERLYIIEAGELSYHNLKRFLPKNEARDFAKYRGQKWVETHKPAIETYMNGRCEIIPMSEIVDDKSYKNRIALIREMYEHGNNFVTDWFNYSADLDLKTRAERKAKDGVIIEPWAIKQNSIDYLCEEYAMLTLMWKRFGLEEIYRGRAIHDHCAFQNLNPNPEIDLTIPKVHTIKLQEVNMIRIGKNVCAEPAGNQNIPQYAKDLGMALIRQ